MASAEAANNFLSGICADIDAELSSVAPKMTFALVVWVKGRSAEAAAVSLFSHPDHQADAPTALRTVADAYDADAPK